jgi:hypothetical protein
MKNIDISTEINNLITQKYGYSPELEDKVMELWEEIKYIKERQVIDSNYEGYTKEDLLAEIKELECYNDILWEYISEKDIEEIKTKMEKL